jgi:hypothetical protein
MNAIRNVEVHENGRISVEFWTVDMPGRDDYCGAEVEFPDREQYELARSNAERKGWIVPVKIPAKTFDELTSRELLTAAASYVPTVAADAKAILARRAANRCECQTRTVDPRDCAIHGHSLRVAAGVA